MIARRRTLVRLLAVVVAIAVATASCSSSDPKITALPDALPTVEAAGPPLRPTANIDADPAAWALVFADDFSSLDTAVWEPGWFASEGFSPPVNRRGAACFHPKQLDTTDGVVTFSLDREDDPDCRRRDESQAAFVGGLINTRESFTFTYGYVEARIFFDGDATGLHNWPAFWHTGFDWPTTGEIDIAEGLSDGDLCSVFHHLGSAGDPVQQSFCLTETDTRGWHTVGAWWEPDRITFYYDGDEVFSVTQGVTASPHYLIANYTARDDGKAIVPSSMMLDYVRVWQVVDESD